MKCLECKQKLSHDVHESALAILGLELCEKHKNRLLKLMDTYGTSLEAILLYYGLKTAGIKPMLQWWDGKKFVDLAISRVKLNIKIDTSDNTISHEQAIMDLEDAMRSFNNGFTTIEIPHVLVKYHLHETVNNIKGLIEELKRSVKVI